MKKIKTILICLCTLLFTACLQEIPVIVEKKVIVDHSHKKPKKLHRHYCEKENRRGEEVTIPYEHRHRNWKSQHRHTTTYKECKKLGRTL